MARTWSSAFSALTAVSHGPRFRLQRDLARVSLADTVRYYHSEADPGSLLGLLGLGPHEVIHVDDSLTSDVAGAARLGMPVAWVNRQGRPVPGAGPRPTYEVADLGELLALLDG